jgi:hypothetical protein
MAQTYYEVLGVAENATDAEIEAAFKSKARQVHPDKIAADTPYLRKVAEEAFKEILEAKTVLLNHAERREYDAGLAHMRGSAANSTSPPSQPAYQAAPPPQQPPPAPTPATQPAQKYSYGSPSNTKFASLVLVLGSLGCLLLLAGITRSQTTASLGLALIFLSLALLSWRRGMKPSTNPRVLGGSVFLFIFAAISFDAWLEPPSANQKSSPSIPPRAASVQAVTDASPRVMPPGSATCNSAGADPCPGTPDPRKAAKHGPSVQKQPRTISQPDAPGEPQVPRQGEMVRIAPDAVPPDQSNVHDEAPLTSQPLIPPTSSEGGTLDSGTARGQRGLTDLSYPEKQSIESACLLPKMNDGPAAYNRCLVDQLARLRSAPRRPDLSSLSYAEKQSIESACLLPKMNDGPAAYNRCLEDQLARLRSAPRSPDLSGLSYPEKQSIESVCLLPKMNDGPAAYNRCLEDQLARLRTVPRPPDLSSLSYAEKQSIESACLLPKMNEGPAAYNRCLRRQMELLRNSPQ